MLSGWFRWQYVLPRVLAVLVALLAVQYMLGLRARSRAIRLGEAMLSGSVDIGHARVSATGEHVVFRDLRVASQGAPGEPWLQADRCELVLGRMPLFAEDTVVTHGRISGLRVSTPRPSHEPACAAAGAGESLDAFNDGADDAASAWFAAVQQRFDKRLVNELASVVQCDALSTRWRSRSAELERRARELKLRAANLQEAVDVASANHLRHAEFFEKLPADVKDLRGQFQALAAEFDKLPHELETERRAIVAFRRQDEQQLREGIRLEPTDPKLLSAYLLHQRASEALRDVIGWLQACRRIVPEGASADPAAPAFLIRALEVDGVANWRGNKSMVQGMLTGVTNAPARFGEPMRLRLRTCGTLPMTLHATIDRTGTAARDELFVDCRRVSLPELSLGRIESLQIKLGPSVGSLLVSAKVEGEKLSGEIQVVQNQVRISPAFSGVSSDVPLSEPLAAALGRVNAVATRISLAGTIERPTWTLWSNLGPAVAEAIEQALRRAGDEHAQRLLAAARRRVDERLAALQRQVSEDRGKFASQMTSVTTQLETIARQQWQRERFSVEHLGRPPADSFLR